MKLDRSTKILLNLALILGIALLLKFLVTIPKTYAAIVPEYKVSSVDQEFANYISDAKSRKLGADWWDKLTSSEKWTYLFNWNRGRGWKYHSFVIFNDELFLVFEHSF
jgi:hypothetical protein